MPLPIGCAPSLIGRGGVAAESLKKQLAKTFLDKSRVVAQAVRFNVRPLDRLVEVQLKLKASPTTLLRLPELTSAADAVARTLRQHIDQLELDHLKRKQDRELAREAYRNDASVYHAELAERRQEYRLLPSAVRALTIPSLDVDGIGCNLIARSSQRGFKGPKVRRRQRRRAELREKRHNILRACSAVIPVFAPSVTFESLVGVTDAEEHCSNGLVRQWRSLSESAYLNPIVTADAVRVKAGTFRKLARRFLRQVRSVAHTFGQPVPPILANDHWHCHEHSGRKRLARRARRDPRNYIADFSLA